MSQDLRQGLRWFAACRLVSQVLSWIGTLAVTKMLTPHDYGVFGIATAFTSVVGVLADIGVSRYLVRQVTLSGRVEREAFGLALAVGMIMAALAVISSGMLEFVYENAEVAKIFRLQAVVFLIAPLSVGPDARLQRARAFSTLAIVDLTTVLATTTSSVLMAFNGLGFWTLVIAQIVSASVRAALLNIASHGQHAPGLPSRVISQDILGFAAASNSSRLLLVFETNVDIAIAGRLLPSAQTGAYSLASYLAQIPLGRILGMLNPLVFPLLASKHRTGDSLARAAEGLAKGVGTVGALIYIGTASIAPTLLPLLLGDKWHDATLPLQLFCLVMPLRMISEALVNALQAADNRRLQVKNQIISAIATLCGCVLGVQFGLVGLAVGAAASACAALLFTISRTLTFLGTRPAQVLRSLLPAMTACAAMSATVLASVAPLRSVMPVELALAVQIVLGATTALVLLWLLDRPGFQLLRDTIFGTR